MSALNDPICDTVYDIYGVLHSINDTETQEAVAEILNFILYGRTKSSQKSNKESTKDLLDDLTEIKDKAQECGISFSLDIGDMTFLKGLFKISAKVQLGEFSGDDIASLSAICAWILDFEVDSAGVYHSNGSIENQFQYGYGYNDFYDTVFASVTDMDKEKFGFNYNNTQYMPWIWKGNYLILGAGNEAGLYMLDDSTLANELSELGGNEHYNVVDFTVPMSTSLYYR